MFSFWSKNRKNTFFQEWFFVNQIFNKFIVCMWTTRYTTLINTKKVDNFEESEFLRFYKKKITISEKLTTDFENLTNFQAETKGCVFLDVDH